MTCLFLDIFISECNNWIV